MNGNRGNVRGCSDSRWNHRRDEQDAKFKTTIVCITAMEADARRLPLNDHSAAKSMQTMVRPLASNLA